MCECASSILCCVLKRVDGGGTEFTSSAACLLRRQGQTHTFAGGGQVACAVYVYAVDKVSLWLGCIHSCCAWDQRLPYAAAWHAAGQWSRSNAQRPVASKCMHAKCVVCLHHPSGTSWRVLAVLSKSAVTNPARHW